MIANSSIVPGLKALHVKLAELLNLLVFWDSKLPLGRCISLEGSFRVLLFYKSVFKFL